MRYFAVVGGAAQQTSVEEKVLASNPIMEKHGGDLDVMAVWLKNAYLLKDLLSQHSPRRVTHLNLNHYFMSYAEMTSHRNLPLLLQDVRGSEELVPLVADVQECFRVLSDLCIQDNQQLLSISESRLQSIIRNSPVPSGSALGPAGTSLPSAHVPAGRLHPQQPAAALGHVLLEPRPADQVFVSLLEEWLRSRSLQTGGAVTALEPLIQAAQLLQMSKTEADGQAMAQACNALSNQQVACCEDFKPLYTSE
ncbi:hypothetical protein cypCar_00001393 [Cyprinus carpio]|nr:hypothetical protein cypCar_00001393 [Cyprinus carpio]